jgi:hypothetical protein
MPYMSVLLENREAGEATTIIVRGFSPNELRRRVECECRKSFGEACRITGETITPCSVSLGGRVRLYEGRFDVAA